MAYDVGVRLEAQGERAFRDSLKAVDAQLRSLGAEMAEVTSRFAAGDRSMASLSAQNQVLQRSIQTTQQKISVLNREYEGQRSRLDELGQALDAVTREYGEGSDEAIRAQNAYNQQARRVSELARQLHTSEAELNRMTRSVEENEEAMRRGGGQLDDFSENTDDVTDSLDKAGKAGLKFGDIIKANIISDAVVGGVKALAGAFSSFLKSSLEVGKTFDASMSQVAATMGKTVDEISGLRKVALENAAATKYTAQETADALNYLALAGYSAEQAADALPAVLNLAAAGGMELAAASDLATDAMSALGIEAGNKNLTEFGDKMALTASKANTSVAQLGEAILQVGATANMLSGGTTELNTALGILADNGTKGAEGGTRLRNVILSLTSPTDKAAAKMKALGVSVFDEQGEMRSLQAVLEDLNRAMDGFSSQQRADVISTLFNKTDLGDVNYLLGVSADRWVELSAAIDDSGGAMQKMADTQMDNLAGDIDKFNSALDNAKIKLSDAFTPALRELTQSLTDVLSSGNVNEMIQKAWSVIMDALSQLIAQLPAFISTVGPILAETGGQLLGSIASGLQAAGPELLRVTSEMLTGLRDAALGMVPSIAEGLRTKTPELIATGAQLLVDLVAGLRENLGMFLDAGIDLLLALADGIVAGLPSLIESVPDLLDQLVQAIGDFAPKMAVGAAELVGKLLRGLWDAFPTILKNIPKWAKLAWDTVTAINWIDLGIDIITSLIKGIFGEESKVTQAANNIADNIKSAITNIRDQALQWGRDLISNFISGITEKYNALKDKISNTAQTVKDFIGFSEPKKGPLSNFHTYAPDMMELFAKGISDSAGMLQRTLAKSLDMGAYYQDVTAGMGNAPSGGMMEQFGGMLAQAVNAMSTAAGNAGSRYVIELHMDVDGKEFYRQTIDDLRFVQQASPEVVND